MILVIHPSGEAEAQRLIDEGKATRLHPVGGMALEDKQLRRLPDKLFVMGK